MIKKIIAAVAGLALAAPVNAASWNDIETLVELVKGTGTSVQARSCQEKGIQGFYHFNNEKEIDLMVICTNSVDMNDPDAVWEVVAHESVHVMQACNGGPVIKDTYLPRIIRDLQSLTPHYWSILQSYPDSDKRMEVEAFWMETRPVEVPIQWVQDFCYTQSDA